MQSLFVLCVTVAAKNNLAGNLPEEVKSAVVREKIKQDCGNRATSVIKSVEVCYEHTLENHILITLTMLQAKAMRKIWEQQVRCGSQDNFVGVRGGGKIRYEEFWKKYLEQSLEKIREEEEEYWNG
jgi:hypothetical protein